MWIGVQRAVLSCVRGEEEMYLNLFAEDTFVHPSLL